jgi:hypothetical protein
LIFAGHTLPAKMKLGSHADSLAPAKHGSSGAKANSFRPIAARLNRLMKKSETGHCAAG